MEFSSAVPYIGNLSQVFDVKSYRLTGGRQEGVSAVDIDNGTGLQFTVLADRCMDFYQIKFRGKNCNYHTPSGIVAPSYYNCAGAEWLRSFFGGFLTTCGLTTTGTGSEDGGETLGIHGRIANTPAEHFNVDVSTDPDSGKPQVVLKGTMKEAVLFGNCLSLTREIVCTYGDNRIRFTDTVENIGYHDTPHMVLYHFNIGYPLLSEKAVLRIPSRKMVPRDEHARETAAFWDRIDPPLENQQESCFYHDLICDSDGISCVGIDNPEENIGIRIRFDKQALPYFVQWRMLGKGEYVTGLEPANAPIDGRAKARADGLLPSLAPGEKKMYRFEIEALDI